MKNYYRIMLGRKSAFAEECLKGNLIGAALDLDAELATLEAPHAKTALLKQGIIGELLAGRTRPI